MKSDKESKFAIAILKTLLGKKTECDRLILAQDGSGMELFRRLIKDNNVSVRLLSLLDDSTLRHWKMDDELYKEKMRVRNNIEFLTKVTKALEGAGCDYTVIKSLDSYPDLGHDLDLFIPASKEKVLKVLSNEFKGKISRPVLSEIISDKTNFTFERGHKLEIHHRRLGVLGEETLLPKIMMKSRERQKIQGNEFFVPCAADKIILAADHRIARHFSIRICDIYNTLQLIKNKDFEWHYLWKTAEIAHLKGAVKFYIDYVRSIDAAIFDQGSKAQFISRVPVKRSYFRFSLAGIMPKVYLEKIWGALSSWNISGLLRLCAVLPLLLLAGVEKIIRRKSSW